PIRRGPAPRRVRRGGRRARRHGTAGRRGCPPGPPTAAHPPAPRTGAGRQHGAAGGGARGRRGARPAPPRRRTPPPPDTTGLRGAAIAAAVIAAFAVGAYAQMPAPQEPGVLTVRSGEWTGDTETLIPGELLQTRIKRVSTPPEYYFSYSAGLTYNTISAITASGGLFRWGDHQGAALGDGSTFGSTAPVQADTGGRIVDVVDEFFYTLALTDGGEVLAWGSAGGAIGDATPGEERFTPEPLPVEGTAMAGAYITQIAGGLDGALALADDGTVFGWGTG